MNLILPVLLSGVGVGVAALAFSNRDNPDWQPNVPAMMALAVGQVLLGAISWVLLSR